MRFVCVDCSFEMDYDEDPNELIDCEECGGIMYADEGSAS